MNSEERILVMDREPAPRRLYRSRTNSVIAGVCGGLGEFLGMDPTLIRLLWLISAFLGGTGALAYFVLAWVIPEETLEHAQAKQARAGWGAGWPRGLSGANMGFLVGLALILLGGVLLLDNLGLIPGFVYRTWRLFWQLLWPLALIALGVVLVLGLSGQAWRQRSGLGGGRPLRRSRDRMVAGVCGGLAEYLGIDPTLVRVLWVFGTLLSLGVIGLLAYLALMLVMPEPDGSLTHL
ncbi:MAG: PspC domain-containing protein [Anaerolineae bacterium]|nr:PspC domain-containing protein [Anaerolineae bacterium]